MVERTDRGGPVPAEGGLPEGFVRAAVRDAEAEYEQAREELVTAVYARRGEFDEKTLEMVEQNLAVIDGAVAEIRTALEQDPENPQWVRMLMATHEKGLTMLGRMAHIPNQG